MSIKFNLKILFLYTILGILFLTFGKNISYSQNNNILFDTANVIRLETISANPKTQLALSLYPFTTILFPAGSFKENVTITIYKDNFDNIKNALPKGQSPISSFYFMFTNSDDEIVFPLKPLKVQSYNNFSTTNTYFYPLKSIKEFDEDNQKQWSGNIKVNTDLPTQDMGFIIAANINIKSDNSSLNPTIVPGSNTNSNSIQKQTNNPTIRTYYWLILILVTFVVTTATSLVLIKIKRRKK